MTITVNSPTSVTIGWTNNETKAYSLYLDRATDLGFTSSVVSEVLAKGTTTFTDTTLTSSVVYYWRVRTVNASGTTNSASVNNIPATPTVPNVIGMSQANATATIFSAQYILGAVTTDYSSSITSGFVINQSPAAGTASPSGTAVALIISLGAVPAATALGPIWTVSVTDDDLLAFPV